jgi:hypothetical protein
MKHLKPFALFLVLMLTIAAVLPSFAQDAEPAEAVPACDDLGFCIVTGTLSFEDDEILLTDSATGEVYVVAPANSFNPSEFQNLEEGQEVILTGILLNDNTIQADSLELVVEEEAEATAEATGEATSEVTPEVTPEITPEVTQEVEGQTGYYCRTPDARHPAGARIAERYGVDYEVVMDMFCEQRMGFGNIARSLRSQETADGGRGNGNGNGNGNANGNGRGNGNGNGNGNGGGGNGNGNGNGNGGGGNGNGNGRGN